MWTGSCAGDLITLLVTLSVPLIAYFRWTYQYWKRRNLPYLEPTIPGGNLGAFFGGKDHVSIRIKRLYDTMKKRGWKHAGIYAVLSPIYLPIDLEYLKNVMSKDFQYFNDHGIYYNEEVDPISAHLFNLEGTKWKNLRAKLTPTFTSGKMKAMFQTLVDCEANLQKRIQQEYEKKAPIDMKELLACFTTDVIGSCAFGLDCQSFEGEDSLFREYGRKIFERNLLGVLKLNFINAYPSLGKKLKLGPLPPEVSSFFMNLVKTTVDHREKNNVDRKDFLQLLINLKKGQLGSEEEYKLDGTTLTVEEIAAQSFLFFAGGFETSSTTMTFTLYELARHRDIQDKIRQEIHSVLSKHGGKFSYEAIQELKFLGQVIDETLRMYPPAAQILRKCVKDYRVPGTDVVISKGTTVIVPVLAIHYDEEYYPDPEKFDPERFTEENKSKRHNFAHIPFGEGPRMCIGMRFALMETKVGLASLLRDFRFTVNKKTKEPLKMKTNSLVLAAQGEIWLNAHKVQLQFN